jgi:hypothetical protein
MPPRKRVIYWFGTVGSAIAPALWTVAVVIMLIPASETALLGLNSMTYRPTAQSTAMTTADIAGTEARLLVLLKALMIRFFVWTPYISYSFG